jgi:hypothetical protein
MSKYAVSPGFSPVSHSWFLDQPVTTIDLNATLAYPVITFAFSVDESAYAGTSAQQNVFFGTMISMGDGAVPIMNLPIVMNDNRWAQGSIVGAIYIGYNTYDPFNPNQGRYLWWNISNGDIVFYRVDFNAMLLTAAVLANPGADVTGPFVPAVINSIQVPIVYGMAKDFNVPLVSVALGNSAIDASKVTYYSAV